MPFYSDYFGVDKKLHSRVKLARNWVDDNCSKYLCLADTGADATSEYDNSMTKPMERMACHCFCHGVLIEMVQSL